MDQHTDIYGVIGHPLTHSLSPIMQNAAFVEKGLNAIYLAFDTENVEDALKGMRALGLKGMSVTIPHKSSVIPLLDQVDDPAKQIGAVNTIVNDRGRLIGYNTDAFGALEALKEKTQVFGKTCLILGAGGAARAIGYILKKQGADLTLANRSRVRGEELANFLECPFIPLEKVADVQVDLLIQTTSVGMYPNNNESIVPSDALNPVTVVMDIVYNPIETKLLTTAKDLGCVTVNGLGMFIRQGAEQFKLWTGLEAPFETMRSVVEEALRKAE
ncbi:MAG: shikimate dehydrogenase [Deltaproteobacteria bacterium]|nr:shikimate dehydrogenase [Deltaproteobacteria bacterium]